MTAESGHLDYPFSESELCLRVIPAPPRPDGLPYEAFFICQRPKQRGPSAQAQSQGNSLRERTAKAGALTPHGWQAVAGRRVGEDVAQRW